MSIPTQEDAHLMVRLFKLRLDPYLQASEQWFNTTFQTGTWAETQEKYPKGSDEWRMIVTVLGYWEMIGALVDHNLISEDLLFDALESMDFTWERVTQWLPTIRPGVGPSVWENIELLANRQKKWQYTRIPKALRP